MFFANIYPSLGVIPEFSYRKVFLQGKWDHAHAILMGPRVNDGANGYHLVEPLVRSDGTTILVDRGFISQEQAEVGISRQDADHEVQVLGMLRTGHARNKFTPDNKPEEGKWYWADVRAMADYAGGESAGVQPVYVEEIFGALPRVVVQCYGGGNKCLKRGTPEKPQIV